MVPWSGVWGPIRWGQLVWAVKVDVGCKAGVGCKGVTLVMGVTQM